MLAQHGVPKGEFPVKVLVPLLLGVQAVVTFDKFNQDAAPRSLFEVPDGFVSPQMAAARARSGASASGKEESAALSSPSEAPVF